MRNPLGQEHKVFAGQLKSQVRIYGAGKGEIVVLCSLSTLHNIVLYYIATNGEQVINRDHYSHMLKIFIFF